MKSAEISSCPVARTAHLIGDAWVVLVLRFVLCIVEIVTLHGNVPSHYKRQWNN